MPISPARSAAFDILLRVEKEHSYASELLHSAAYARLTPADHSLATELVMGVLRWRSLLDDQISRASTQPLAKLDVQVLVALRLAVYQFGWLDRIPRRAALHESVELVKRARKSSAAAFVNAVLRKLTDFPSHSSDSFQEQELTAEALAHLSAHPLWLVERWAIEYGLAAARQICRHNQSKPVTAIRLRTTAAEEEIRADGVTLAPGKFLSSSRRIVAGEVTRTEAFRSADITIEDEASQLVAALVALGAERGATILDCCAAPGGKTLGIADRIPESQIIAAELHPHRARLLEARIAAARLAARIRVIAADVRCLPFSRSFDRVLADVPCSGTGTLSRNPEIKWRLKPEDLRDLQARQCAILNSAMAQVVTGGRLIYATCSLEKEENEDVIETALNENKSFRLIDCRDELDQMKRKGELIWTDTTSLTKGKYLRTMPGIHPCDGFFAAILQRV